ncbi:MAG TPA: ZIP family metal transporter [Pirellulales bacterium]|jgi:zinc and cadmium transporter|nr:ZIP family metal transporter [Pirellulales bacterium]
MSQPALLAIYCASIVFASLLGGCLPLLFRLTHVGLQIAMSFVGGAMLGVGLLNMLPHANEACHHDPYVPAICLLCGFLVMFFVERVFHFHHHDAPVDAEGACDHDDHEHPPHHHHHDHSHGQPQRLTWGAALAGLVLHSALDGIALAASVQAESESGATWAGWVVFAAICLHTPFDSLTLGTLMAVAGRSAALRHAVNALYALAVPLGAIFFSLVANKTAGGEWSLTGAMLAFSAGTFLYIATSDLLPELQFHSHDGWKLSLALLAGIALAGVGAYFDHAGHSHHDTHSENEHHHLE